jgi:atrial natriuretic peptide receptor A
MRSCSYPSCSGDIAPGLAADMHFKAHVIAFIGPACAFALEPVARLAAYWNRPIITGMGDQVSLFLECIVASLKWSCA